MKKHDVQVYKVGSDIALRILDKYNVPTWLVWAQYSKEWYVTLTTIAYALESSKDTYKKVTRLEFLLLTKLDLQSTLELWGTA